MSGFLPSQVALGNGRSRRKAELPGHSLEAIMFVVVCKPIDEGKDSHKVFSNRTDAKRHANHIVAADEGFKRADIYEVSEDIYAFRAIALVGKGEGTLVDASVKPATPWQISNNEQLGALNRLAAVLEKFLNELFYEARAKIEKLDLRAEFTQAIEAAGKRRVPDPEEWFVANVALFGVKKADDRLIRRRAEELAADVLNLVLRPIPPDPPDPKPLKRKRLAPKRRRKTSAPGSRKRTPRQRKLDLDF
jgi:hypothetical protein